MRKLLPLFVLLLLCLTTSPVFASDEDESPTPPDDVECPEDSVDMEHNVCVVEEEQGCPEGFETIETGAGDLCFCESGQTNNMGGCVTGSDDPNNDGCPPGYFAEGEYCLPTSYDDDLNLSDDGCPDGYEPIGGPGSNICHPDNENQQPCQVDSIPGNCAPDCPHGWYYQTWTGICFPYCTFYEGYGRWSNFCDWGNYDPGDVWTGGTRAVVTATDVTFFHYYGWNQPETFELDHTVGNECGPWETLIYGNCEALCEIYNVDCPTEEDPWIWFGYPRWND